MTIRARRLGSAPRLAVGAPFLLRILVATASAAYAGCDAPEPPEPTIDEVPDCEVLVQAARRASGCDANLMVLANELSRHPVETRCRRVARRLLTTKRATSPGVHSIHEPAEQGSALPLDPSERAALLELPLPAMVTVIPDLAPGPGVPRTSGVLDATPLESDTRGRLHARVLPGLHTMTVRHAGQETSHCIDLEPCARLAVTSHGSSLAQHPRIRRGPCDAPTSPDPDPSAPVANR